MLGKSKAAVAWPFNLLKDETLKLIKEAQETKARITEKRSSEGLTKGKEEPSEADRKRGSAIEKKEHDHREYFRHLIEKSNQRSGLGTS